MSQVPSLYNTCKAYLSHAKKNVNYPTRMCRVIIIRKVDDIVLYL